VLRCVLRVDRQGRTRHGRARSGWNPRLGRTPHSSSQIGFPRGSECCKFGEWRISFHSTARRPFFCRPI
jgi:hypothetical protein